MFQAPVVIYMHTSNDHSYICSIGSFWVFASYLEGVIFIRETYLKINFKKLKRSVSLQDSLVFKKSHRIIKEIYTLKKDKYLFAFHIISSYWNGTGGWNLALTKTKSHLSYATDDLAVDCGRNWALKHVSKDNEAASIVHINLERGYVITPHFSGRQ